MSELDAAITDHTEGAVLAVVVVPRSGKTAIDRIGPDAVRIRLAAAPVDGAANAALLRYLADLFDRPRTSLRLLSGTTSRRKRVLIAGVTRAEVVRRLEQLAERPTA